MSEKLFRTALVGCGTIAQNHLKALAELKNVRVVALCDISQKKAEAMRDEYAKDARLYTDYTEMLELEKPDSVHIATPHFLHCEMTLEALEHGINVLLEKPMCISTEEIAKIIEAEKKSSAYVTVCLQNRYNAATIKAKELVAADGGAVSAYGTVFWERGEKYYTESDWRGTYLKEGGGVMINQAIHTIDLLCEFLGKPERLWATKANHHLKGVIECEDSCEGMILFESGRYGNFYATSAFHGCDSTALFIKTENHKIELHGRTLYVDGAPIELCEDKFVGKYAYGNGHEVLIRDFYDALSSERVPPVSPESAQYALRILLAAYKSNDKETII